MESRYLIRLLRLLLLGLCLSWRLSLSSSFRFSGFFISGYTGFSGGLIIQTCSNNCDTYIVCFFIIIESTKDNICILSGKILHIACCVVGIHKRNISGYIDDHMGSTLDSCLQQRTGYSLLNSFHSLVVAFSFTDTDMCKAIDKRMEITDIHLVEKMGGKSGYFKF